MKTHLTAATLALLLLPCFSIARAAPDTWEADVRQFDAQYWQAFNGCDVAKVTNMNTEDLEFYHDVGGLMHGRASFSEAVTKNICYRADGSRIRREAIAAGIKYYPLRDGARLYGALVTGEHRFYTTLKGGVEELTGQARFTNTLLLKDGAWKVARVLSFDHGPARR
jgi:hypothetical protein